MQKDEIYKKDDTGGGKMVFKISKQTILDQYYI